jgi:hypothetical protein
MHVAVVTLNALMLSGINRFVGALGWLYAGVISVASVYLGWHYAIDGYVSIALVSLIWWLCGRVAQAKSAWPLAQGGGSMSLGGGN